MTDRPALDAVVAALDGITDPQEAVEVLIARGLWFADSTDPMPPRKLAAIASLGLDAVAALRAQAAACVPEDAAPTYWDASMPADSTRAWELEQSGPRVEARGLAPEHIPQAVVIVQPIPPMAWERAAGRVRP